MTMLKLGEEARVSLVNFSLDGSSRIDLRRTKKKADEAGLRFRIVPQPSAADLMPQLKTISDAWLGEKSTAEKGFSLGYFNEPYLRQYDIAMVYRAGRPIAFANLWKGADKRELSIDLMRYLPDSPHGVMEFLFIELMLYGAVTQRETLQREIRRNETKGQGIVRRSSRPTELDRHCPACVASTT